MQLTFLAGHEGSRTVPLTKRFSLDEHGDLVKHSYPHVHRFTTFYENVSSLSQFEKALKKHAKQHHCLLKGYTTEHLQCESRAGLTDSATATEWICLDIDGIADITKPADLLAEIPDLRGVHYVVQYSSSQGVDPNKGLSAHIFMMLTEPVEPLRLKEWLKHLNLTVPILRDNIRLSPTGAVLTWPLDITTCQNDKLLYIAPPLCRDGATDQFTGERIQYVKSATARRLTLDLSAVRPEWNRAESTRVLNQLRANEGLAKKTFSTKSFKGVEVLSGNPGPVAVTSWKLERGFVYLNLDGGDSWGYFFPADNPEVLYNFKGEPNYKLKELAPDFYQQYKKDLDERLDAERTENAEQGAPLKSDENTRVLAFRDRRSDAYFMGHYNEETGYAEFHRTSDQSKIAHYFIEHGLQAPSYIPTWDYAFRFDKRQVIDVDSKFLNRYCPTPYMDIEPARKAPALPPIIHKVIHSVFCGEPELIEHFLNWVAAIYQHRIKTQTAWLIQGTEGTGKGVLFNHILSPIFGGDYCKKTSINQIEDQFNQYLEDTVLLFIDESDVSTSLNSQKIMSRLRDYITEPTMTIRPMRANLYQAPSYLNIIVATNRPAAVLLTSSDRRFNIAPRQEAFLDLSDADMDQLSKELEPFALHLASREVDLHAARRPIQTQARDELVQTTVSSTDAVAEALLHGDFEFFYEALPSSDAFSDDDFAGLRKEAYLKVLREAAQYVQADEAQPLTRDQMHTLFRFCVDRVPETPKKFTHFLKHHRIFTRRMRKGEEQPYGMHVRWEAAPEIVARLLEDKERMRSVK